MKRLMDKIAIITGGGRGIGFAGAQAFVREGAKVVIAEINEELGREAEAALRAAGGEATFVQTDVSDSASVQALMARTETLYGGLHVLYNNASVFLNKIDGPVTELAEETWAKVLAINLHSIFLCCKYGIPLMGDRQENRTPGAGHFPIPQVGWAAPNPLPTAFLPLSPPVRPAAVNGGLGWIDRR